MGYPRCAFQMCPGRFHKQEIWAIRAKGSVMDSCAYSPTERSQPGLQGLMESCRVSAVIYCCVCKCVNVFLASSFARRLLMSPAGFGQKCSWIMFHMSPVNWVVIDPGLVTCTWQVSLLDCKCERLASAGPSERCRIYWGGNLSKW